MTARIYAEGPRHPWGYDEPGHPMNKIREASVMRTDERLTPLDAAEAAGADELPRTRYVGDPPADSPLGFPLERTPTPAPEPTLHELARIAADAIATAAASVDDARADLSSAAIVAAQLDSIHAGVALLNVGQRLLRHKRPERAQEVMAYASRAQAQIVAPVWALRVIAIAAEVSP